MTYEEALEYAKGGLEVYLKDYPELTAQIEFQKLGIEALERAIPKKPFVEPYFYGKYYRCPTCGRMVEKNKCCSNNNCRQRIDWSK